MKRILILVLILLLCLTACKKAPAAATPGTTGTAGATSSLFPNDLPTGNLTAGMPIQFPDVSRSNQIGQYSISEKLEVVDAEGLTGTLIDPSATKKTTVVYFWTSTSQECVDALTWMEQLVINNPDTLTLLAVHSLADSDSMPQFIYEYYNESPIHFMMDIGQTEHGDYYTAMGGTGTYPYVAVLDKNGKNVQLFSSLPTQEELAACIAGA